MLFWKALFLFMAICHTFGNVVKLYRDIPISKYEKVMMSVGIVGYILVEFWID